MPPDLDDEVTSINSIYGDDTLQILDRDSLIYSLTIPSYPSILLRVQFPPSYPADPPHILGTQSVGEAVPKGEGKSVVEVVRDALAKVYENGTPCVYDLLQETDDQLQLLSMLPSSDDGKRSEAQDAQAYGQNTEERSLENTSSDARQSAHELGNAPPWILSETLVEKKSVFLARAAPVESVSQAKSYLAHVLASDKKAAKATHNITAWRIRGNNDVKYQDCDDDGETAAGGRVLHLLELMDAWNVMVVVTRWYGGIQLGPDRFRLINQAARDAVIKGGFVSDPNAAAGKKKGKK